MTMTIHVTAPRLILAQAFRGLHGGGFILEWFYISSWAPIKQISRRWHEKIPHSLMALHSHGHFLDF